MQSTRRGLGRVYLRGSTWWVQYSHRGRKVRESSGSSNRADAVRLLKRRLGEMGSGKLVGPDAEKVTLGDLGKILLDDYSLQGNTSTDRAKRSLVRIEACLGKNARAMDIGADTLAGYVSRRREEGAAPATIRVELAALKRAFNLAVRAGRLPQRPAFPAIAVNNRRTGFFEDGEFKAVLEHLPADVRPVAEFLYHTGWRKAEVLSLEWRMVDAKAGIIRIEDTKNGEPRTLPYKALPELAALIERQRERTDALQDAKGIIVPHVFHRDGEPIRSFRGAWKTACTEAGYPDRIVHDFRRTVARNLSRAGVPERVIMSLCGWKTRSVFDRYRIVSETDLAEGLAKMANATETAGPPAPKVLPMRRGTVGAQSGVLARAGAGKGRP